MSEQTHRTVSLRVRFKRPKKNNSQYFLAFTNATNASHRHIRPKPFEFQLFSTGIFRDFKLISSNRLTNKKKGIATHRNVPNAPRPINFNGSKSSTHIFRPVPDPDAVVAVDTDPIPSASTPRVISSAPEEDPIVFVPPTPGPDADVTSPPAVVVLVALLLFVFSVLDFLANVRENHDVPPIIATGLDYDFDSSRLNLRPSVRPSVVSCPFNTTTSSSLTRFTPVAQCRAHVFNQNAASHTDERDSINLEI